MIIVIRITAFLALKLALLDCAKRLLLPLLWHSSHLIIVINCDQLLLNIFRGRQAHLDVCQIFVEDVCRDIAMSRQGIRVPVHLVAFLSAGPVRVPEPRVTVFLHLFAAYEDILTPAEEVGLQLGREICSLAVHLWEALQDAWAQDTVLASGLLRALQLRLFLVVEVLSAILVLPC